MNRGISPELYQRVLDLITPPFEIQTDRITLLRLYLGSYPPFWSQITWEGSSLDFSKRLINLCLDHPYLSPGRPSLVEVIRIIQQNQLGAFESQKIESLVNEVAQVVAAIGFAKPPATPPVPSLLPYLLDWEEQEYRLEEALIQVKSQPNRIMLCCVHGDESQCLDKFLDRLELETLPEALDIDPARMRIQMFLCEWPSSLKNLYELPGRLNHSLAENVLGHGVTSQAEIQSHLAAYPTPVIIHTHLLTEDLERHDTNAIQAYVDYWKKWPELQPGQQLIIFLFFKYQIFSNLNFFQRRRFNAINSQTASLLETKLASMSNPIYALTLPRLESITRSQAENWARKEVPEHICPIEVLMNEITRLYNEWQKNNNTSVIPMEQISSYLKDVLGKNMVAREVRI